MISNPELENFGDDYLHWNDSNMDSTNFLSPKANEGTFGYSLLESPPSVHHSTPSTYQALQLPAGISLFDISIPSVPNPNIRKLVQRTQIKTGTQRTANLILYTLKSYPRMLLRPNTLPPFIHPHLISSNGEDSDMELLTNCMSLVHMISNGVQGNRKLFWKNVRMECERMHAEVELAHHHTKIRHTDS
jgi:hypothetical protein